MGIQTTAERWKPMDNEVKSNREKVKQQLLGKHPSDRFGLWEIRGEDPNCDLGGSHHMPLLTRVEGEYAEAVELAVSLDGFFNWGPGGSVELVEFAKLEKGTAARLRALQEQRTKLRLELDEVETELRQYGRKV